MTRPDLATLLFALGLAAGCGDNHDAGAPDAGTPPAPDAAAIDAPPPPPPGLRLLDYFMAVDITPAGDIAAFEDASTGEATLVLIDTVTGEPAGSAVVGDPARVMATGIAADRRISSLHGEPVQAGVWTPAGGWLDLGSPHPAGCGGAEVSGAFDLSADGSVVVGLAWNGCAADAFRWTDAGGAGAFTTLEVLGTPPPGVTRPPTNRASVISDNGQVTAGFAENGGADRSPAIWAADASGFMLDPTNQDTPGEVLSISADGATVAGIWGYDGFVWTSATGTVTLPRLDVALPSDPMFPNAIAAGGALVFGGSGSAFFTLPTAFVWSAAAGTRAVADVAAAAGVAIPAGTVLENVLGASADGTVLIGTALDSTGVEKTFVLRVPATAFTAP